MLFRSKRDLIGIYTQEILQKRPLLGRFMVTGEGSERDVYVELPKDFQIESITVPDAFVDRTVGDIAPGSHYGIQLLQVRHRDPVSGKETVELPKARSRLGAGDQLVVIGTSDAIQSFQRGRPPGDVENWNI